MLNAKAIEAFRTPVQREKHARKEYYGNHKAFVVYSSYEE